jgi:hypothetical protein
MTAETKSPDPVLAPKAYQDMLLGLLGPDDPAEVQAGTPAAIRALVADAGSALRTPPEPGGRKGRVEAQHPVLVPAGEQLSGCRQCC